MNPPATTIKQEQEQPSGNLAKRETPDASDHKNNDLAASTGNTENDPIELSSDSDDGIEDLPPPKSDHGLSIIAASEIHWHLHRMGSNLQVVQLKREPDTPKEQYNNGIHQLQYHNNKPRQRIKEKKER